MVKLEQVLKEFPQYGNDPLMVPVKMLISQRKKLSDLKSQASGFIIPTVTLKGTLEPGFDPDRMEEVKTLASNIEATRNSIRGLESKIGKLEAVAEKHNLERPAIRELQSNISLHRGMLETAKREPDAILGNILVMGQSIEQAQQSDAYTKACKKRDLGQALHLAHLKAIGEALDELEGVLNGSDQGAA